MSGTLATPPATETIRGPFAALLIKEIRQQIPMFVTLAAATTLATVLATMMASLVIGWLGPDLQFWLGQPVFPMLFAVGAGAAAVSQEKELGSLCWLRSMPVEPSRIVAMKFVVSAGLLVSAWGVWWLMTSSRIDGWAPSLVLWSGWLLVAGFTTAWLFSTAMSALFALVALAALPVLLINTLEFFGVSVADEGNWVIAAFVVVGVAVMAMVGLRALAPAAAPSGAGVVVSDDDEVVSVPRLASPTRREFSALLWQRWYESPLLNYSAVGLIVSAVLVVGYSATGGETGPFLGGVWVAVALVITWWGASAFLAGGGSRQGQFLAGRGVGPLRQWAARHVLPLAFLSAGIAAASLGIASVNRADEWDMVFPSMLMSVWLVIVAYGVSQWVGQCLRFVPPLVLVAPLFVIIAVAFFVEAYRTMGVPTGVIFALSLIPFGVTAINMGDHLDGRRGIRFWLIHVAGLLLVASIPPAIAWSTTLRWPTVTAAERSEWLAAATSARSSSGPASPAMTVGSRLHERFDRAREYTTDSRREIPVERLADLVTPLSIRQINFGPDYALPLKSLEAYRQQRVTLAGGVGQVRGAIAVARTLVAESEADDADWEHFANVLDLSAGIVAGLRETPGLMSQTVADSIEAAMAAAMDDDIVRDRLASGWAALAVEQLSDRQRRTRSRRRAVLGEYWRWHHLKRSLNLPIRLPDPMLFADSWQANATEVYVVTLLELLDAIEAERPPEPMLRQLHQVSDAHEVSFENGPFARAASGGGASPELIGEYETSRYPGCVWGAPWERIDWTQPRTQP